jgi:hypothetical protein
MQITTHDSLASAYTEGLRELLRLGQSVDAVEDPASIASRFGTASRPTRELCPYAFSVADPAAALIVSDARRAKLEYLAGQWAWVMRGSSELAPIAYYNSRGTLLSDDGHQLNAAFGARMRAGHDQIEHAIRKLRSDRASRRAFISIARPADLVTETRDQACAIGLQLFLRGDRLEAVTLMRSQSALLVLPYDAALFMGVHVWLAAALGVEAGRHTWIANSFHVYEDELALVEDVLSEPVTAARYPACTDAGSLAGLLRTEATLREGVAANDLGSIREIADAAVVLDPFHAAFRAVFVATAGARTREPHVIAQGIAGLPDSWQAMIPAAWPQSAAPGSVETGR